MFQTDSLGMINSLTSTKINFLETFYCIPLNNFWRDFDYDLPLCVFLSKYDLQVWIYWIYNANLFKVKIILDILKVDHWQGTESLSVMLNILTKHMKA